MRREEPIIIKVVDVFKEQYRIPIYQRNYTWGEEINQLLDDIERNIKNIEEDEYYLGNLIVNRKEDEKLFEVIDGQQRLTTLFLLCLYLDQTLIKKTLKFEARKKYRDTLKAILKKESEQNKEDCVEELINGYNRIEAYFKGKEISEKETFKEKLNNIKLVRVQVPEGTDFNQYFEIMNTRGEQLELHEIVKARLLKKLIGNSEDKRIGAKIWEACEKMDTYIQMNFNSEERTSIFGSNWDSFEVKNFEELKEKMSEIKQEEDTGKKLKEILEEFEKKAEGYPKENKQDTSKEEEKERFESILTFPNFILQVNAVLDGNSNLSDEKFIEKIEENSKDASEAKTFLFELLRCRFFYDNYIIKREKIKDGKDEREWSLKKLFREIKLGDKKTEYKNVKEKEENDRLKTLQACLRITYTSPITMEWITEVLRSLAKDKNANLIEVLEKYAKRRVEKSKFEEAEGFGFERIVFSYLDYILYRDNILNRDENTVKYPYLNKMKEWQFRFRNSIEHFYPQESMGGLEDWKDDSELNDFGNLALITAPDNSRFSNFPPEDKVRIFPEITKQSLKLTIMEVEMNKNEGGWTKELVKKHGREMKKILKEECEKR